MHGELGAVEAEVRVLPLVAEHFGLALAHPAGVRAVFAVAELLDLGAVVGWVFGFAGGGGVGAGLAGADAWGAVGARALAWAAIVVFDWREDFAFLDGGQGE